MYDHQHNQIFDFSTQSRAKLLSLYRHFKLNGVYENLFLFSTNFLPLSFRLKFYLDTFRPDFSDFPSKALVTTVKVPFANRLFLNTCSLLEYKTS